MLVSSWRKAVEVEGDSLEKTGFGDKLSHSNMCHFLIFLNKYLLRKSLGHYVLDNPRICTIRFTDQYLCISFLWVLYDSRCKQPSFP
jgi:hypothetical protein